MFRLLLSLLLLLPFAAANNTSCSASARTYAFKFGEFKALVLEDTVLTLPPNAMLVPQRAVERAWRFYEPDAQNLTVGLNVVLLERAGERILVDTGFGTSLGGRLVERLSSRGVSAESIDAVLVTHGHNDHVNGLLASSGAAAFPNAKVYIRREEFEFWSTDPAELGKRGTDLEQDIIDQQATNFVRVLAPYKDRVILVDDTQRLFGSSVEIIATPGHTPGHMSVRIRSAGRSLFVVGDAAFTKVTSFQNPTWTIFSDTNRSMAVTTRLDMLDGLVADKSLVLSYHERFPGLGYVVPMGPWYDYSYAPLTGPSLV